MITLHTPGTLPNLSRPQLEHLIPQPLVIQSKGLIQYGEPKIPFSAKRIVMGNPILLVLALGAAMAVGLPKIMVSCVTHGMLNSDVTANLTS
jgi:hypothetical protein